MKLQGTGFFKITITIVLSLSMLGIAGQSFAAEEKIVVFIRTGPEAEGMRPVADQFTKDTGIEVEFMEVGRSGYFSTMTSQLVSGTDAFDLVATNSAYVAQLAAADALEPLDGYLASVSEDYDADDILFMYGYGGKTYSIPFDVSTHFLYYRKDLIETPPQSWDEYVELAKQWTKSKNTDSPTQFGLSLTALPGPELPKVFYSLMWSLGGEILDDSGTVQLGNEAAVKAAEFYRMLAKEDLLTPDIISWGFPNVLDALKTGVVAMAAPYWNAAYPQIVKSDSPHKDNIGITLVPGVKKDDGTIYRTPFQHGWALVMNGNSAKKEAAWKFFEYATSKTGMLTYSRNGGTPSRKSVLQNPDLQPREYFDLMLQSLEIANAEPPVPYYLEMHEVMNQALTEILTGSQTPADVMQDAAQRIQELKDSVQ
ncbi:MAG: extracellular solute-binding protein [bacterium]|nr:extracellular solute-binding protein [bacterium]